MISPSSSVTSKGEGEDEVLNLHCRVWFYVDPEKLPEHVCNFAEYMRRRLPSHPRWEVRAVQDWKAAKSDNLNLFAPLEVELATRKCCGKHPRKPDQELFEEVWGECWQAVRASRFKGRIGLEKDSVMVCFQLWDPKAKEQRSIGDKVTDDNDIGGLSRWMLPAPEEPTKMPAERVELVLYKLAGLKLRQKDNGHCGCTGYDVFECVENQVYKQKIEWQLLNQLLEDLKKMSTDDVVRMHDVIDQAVEAMEKLSKTTSSIVALFTKHVGRKGPITGNVFIWVVKKLFRKKLAAIAIDDQSLEDLKKSAQSDLEGFQRVAPLLAAHVRMRAPSRWQELDRACKLAPAGPERHEMPMNMAINPEVLYSAVNRAAGLTKVHETYTRAYERVSRRIDALVEQAGRLYVERNLSDAVTRAAGTEYVMGEKMYIDRICHKRKGCRMEDLEKRAVEKMGQLLEDNY